MSKSRFDKHCIVCGAHYEYCGNCDKFKNMPRWMESFHDNNCRVIFNTIMEYRTGIKTPAECAEILKNCDLSYRDKLRDGLDEFVTAILADGADAAKEEPKVEEAKIDVVEEPKVKDKEAKAEEPKQEKKFNGYKKNNFKK